MADAPQDDEAEPRTEGQPEPQEPEAAPEEARAPGMNAEAEQQPTPDSAPVSDPQQAEIARLREELRKAKRELVWWNLVTPFFVFWKKVMNATALAEAIGQLRTRIVDDAIDPSDVKPKEVFVTIFRNPSLAGQLAEAWFLWRCRHRWGLWVISALAGIIAGAVATIVPAYYVAQQNTLVGQQTAAIKSQVVVTQQQSEAVAEQVRVAKAQSKLLEESNKIQSEAGLQAAYYQARHHPLMAERWQALSQLLKLNETDYSGIALRGEFKPRPPNALPLSAGGEQTQGVYGQIATQISFGLATTRLAGSTMGTVILQFPAPGQVVDLTGVTLENCALVFRQDASQTVILERAYLTNCTVAGRLAGISLRGAVLTRTDLRVRWNPGQGILDGTRFEGVALGVEKAKDADAARKNRIDLSILATAGSLWDLRGLAKADFQKLKEARPVLMEWWPME